MKVDVTLDKEEVKEAVRQYLEDAGYGTDKADVQFNVGAGASSIPRGPSGPHLRNVKIKDVKT